MTAEIIPFNPLDVDFLGASVAETFVASKVHPLGDLPEFKGAGIYAIYYSGSFAPYAELSRRNGDSKTAPIYIGKAVPAGARKGGGAATTDSKALFSRLSEHAESIRSVNNLDIRDFTCRLLVVDSVWIPLGESLLIARYAPVWNSVIDGFGNHNPGGRRLTGMRPRWDEVHPGRAWAAKCADRKETAADIMREAETYLRDFTFPTTSHFIRSGD